MEKRCLAKYSKSQFSVLDVRSDRFNLAGHGYPAIAVDDLDLSNIVHVFIHDDSILLTSVERTRGSIENPLGKGYALLYVSPQIDHVDQI